MIDVMKLAAALLLSNVPYEETSMVASWYDCVKPGECSWHKITASGEKFNPNAYTAAHKSLPFGTKLLVGYKDKYIVVRINDRGPFVKGRHLDLSRAAARHLGCGGVCKMQIYILDVDKKKSL